MPKEITFDLKVINKALVNNLIKERVDEEKTIRPQLTAPENIRKPQAYKRFQHQTKKIRFRKTLVNKLYTTWTAHYGQIRADELQAAFLEMASQISEAGALIFGDLINKEHFTKLVHEYDRLLDQHRNKIKVLQFEI